MEKNHRPWGCYEVLLDHPEYKVKRITLNPYQKFSLQYHNFRSEHWVVVEGDGKVILDGSEYPANLNTSWYVSKNSIHRAEAGSDGLVLIETQIGNCYEEDIVRIQDDYDRALTFQSNPYRIKVYKRFIMDYKPYSMEWSRKRYLAEAIQKYFDTDASLDVVLDDIVGVLEENFEHHKSRAEKFQEVLNGLKSLPY